MSHEQWVTFDFVVSDAAQRLILRFGRISALGGKQIPGLGV
jgi:hypothetical protein